MLNCLHQYTWYKKGTTNEHGLLLQTINPSVASLLPVAFGGTKVVFGKLHVHANVFWEKNTQSYIWYKKDNYKPAW